MKITNRDILFIEAEKWNPHLQTVTDIDVCADCINIPHGDYPALVPATKDCILQGIENYTKDDVITEREIKQIHSLVMREMQYIKIGDWRWNEVHINNDDGTVFHAPEAYLAPQLMMSIFPLEIGKMTKEDIITWYKRFETIHPFEDGNGRVGGIVMAIISYINFEEFITTEIFDK